MLYYLFRLVQALVTFTTLVFFINITFIVKLYFQVSLTLLLMSLSKYLL